MFNRARFDAARAFADALLRDDDKERSTGAILVAGAGKMGSESGTYLLACRARS